MWKEENRELNQEDHRRTIHVSSLSPLSLSQSSQPLSALSSISALSHAWNQLWRLPGNAHEILNVYRVAEKFVPYIYTFI